MKFIVTIGTLIFVSILWIVYITSNPNKSQPGMIRFLSLDKIDSVNETERIRLGGLVKTGSIQVSKNNQLECNFELNQGEKSISVNFNGTRPDLFKDKAEVIVEGNYVDGTFIADQLQTKCASRYEGELKEETSYQTQSI
tara:strand:+ start:1191 stop:1610 length:420 start_codon:yes stop_codon:yes gene_type:complete